MAKKRKQAEEQDDDPLGKCYQTFSSTTSAIVGMSAGGFLGVAGLLLLIIGLVQGSNGLIALIAGGVLLVAALGVAGYAFLNYGQSFEVRRKGVRFTVWGRPTELKWKDMDYCQVDYQVLEELPVVTRMHDGGTFTSLPSFYKKIHCEIFLYAPDEMIHLTPRFCRQIRHINTLVELIKMHSGKEVRITDLA